MHRQSLGWLALGLIGLAATSQAQKVEKKLYCWDDRGTRVCGDALPAEAVHWWRRVERCRALERAANRLKGEAENKLAAAFGSATFGILPDGQLLSYKTQDRAGFTVEPTSFRVLRKVNPKKK